MAKENVDKLLSLEIIRHMALPSNLRYGTAIHKRGAIELIDNTPKKVEAWVGGLDGSVSEGGGSRRRTRLSSTENGLAWHCTGNPKNHQIFCKHCVALALALVNKRG